MPTIERHDYINSFHHVYLRGLDRHVIFFDDQDRYKFLSCLRQAQKKYGFRIHAYCLMDNHYHLYLQSVRGNLSRAMQSINMRYALYHNLKRERNGAVFESRFNSKLVQSEKYSLNIIRYIHRNPLEANICSRLEDYYWSSYPAYIGKREPEEFVDLSYIANQLDLKSFIKEFKKFHCFDESYDFFDNNLVYGDENFVKQMLEPAIVQPYGEYDHEEWIDSQLIELFYEAIYTRPDLNQRECLWLYVYALQALTSLNYQEIVDLVDAPNKEALKQMNYRFRKGRLSTTDKFASIYKGLKAIRDDVNTKRYGVTTRSE